MDFSVEVGRQGVVKQGKYWKSFGSALSGLSEKVTSLCKRLPIDYKNRAGTIGDHSHRERELKYILDSYKQNLCAEIAIRNMSKEKLASTQSLEINQFSGCNSLVVIYTFQSEFEKLYLPSLQKKLIPDFLKNKYLEGHAIVLVKNIGGFRKNMD